MIAKADETIATLRTGLTDAPALAERAEATLSGERQRADALRERIHVTELRAGRAENELLAPEKALALAQADHAGFSARLSWQKLWALRP